MTTPRLQRAPARVVLKDRVLMLGVAADVPAMAPDIDQTMGGAVLVGTGAHETVRALRAAYPDMILLCQPAAHKTREATADTPFPFAEDEQQNPLFRIEQTLDDYLDAQMNNGASAAILPTGFIPAGAHRTMTGIIKAANGLNRDDVIVHLPVSHKWLSSPGDLDKLTSAVQRCRHPVAISMAHRSDPASQSGVVAGIHRLLSVTTDGVALWHADLGVFDALVHGALGGAIGVTARNRHIVAPDEVAHSPSKGADQTPNVLLTDHLRFKKSQQMTRHWFANGGEPSCPCRVCGGQKINRFDSSRPSRLEAHRHNLENLIYLHRELLSAPYPDIRWAELLADAELAHQNTAIATGIMAIKPDGALKQWINLNPLP